MRRDLDLPVFVSLATRRSPAPRSLRTSSGVAPHAGGPETSPSFRLRLARRFGSASGRLRFGRSLSIHLVGGPSWADPLPRGSSPWGGNMPSRQPGPTLPAPLTGWSGWSRWRFAASSPRGAVQLRTRGSIHRLPAEIGSSVLSSPSRRCQLPERGGDFRPDHPLNLTRLSESRKAESSSSSLWITGILRITPPPSVRRSRSNRKLPSWVTHLSPHPARSVPAPIFVRSVFS
jgi:hypothetical protein